MAGIKQMTPHCWIEEGQTHFLRKVQLEERHVVHQSIHDALTQCFHILDRNIGAVVKFYQDEPVLFGPGEVQEMEEISQKLQQVISAMVSQRDIGPGQALSAARTFELIGERLGRVRNEHKFRAQRRIVTMPPLTDEKGRKSTTALVQTGEVQTDILKRYNELYSITRGTFVQAQRLLQEIGESEERIAKFIKALNGFAPEVGGLVSQIEEDRINGWQPDFGVIFETLQTTRAQQLFQRTIRSLKKTKKEVSSDFLWEKLRQVGGKELQLDYDLIQGLKKVLTEVGDTTFPLAFTRLERVVRLQEVAEKISGKGGLINSLQPIVANPYLDRVSHADVRSLFKLGQYLQKGNLQAYQRAFQRARGKLIRVLWQKEAQRLAGVYKSEFEKREI